jgi:hypothetical protein
MKYSLSASMVAATRRASYLFPRVTVVRGYEYEKWRGTCEAIRTACRRSYQLFGHCENPFPVGDVRRWVWIDESYRFIPPAAPVAWEIDEYDESVAARLWESRQ